MRHMSTTLAMAAWTGFFGAWSLRLADAAGIVVLSEIVTAAICHSVAGVPTVGPVPDLPGHEAVAFSALFAALAIAGLVAIATLTAPAGRRATRPEAVVSGILCASAAFYLACELSGSPLVATFGDGPLFLLLLALTFGALLFDRLVEVDDDVADSAAFEAVLRSLRAAEIEAARERWRCDVRSHDEANR